MQFSYQNHFKSGKDQSGREEVEAGAGIGQGKFPEF